MIYPSTVIILQKIAKTTYSIISVIQYFDDPKPLYGDEVRLYSTVKNWFNEFNRRRSLKDEVHEGRSKTGVVLENIEVVRVLIMQDRHVTYRELEPFLGISPTCIDLLLH